LSSSLVDTALAHEIGRYVGLQAEEIDTAHRLAVLLRPHLRLRFLSEEPLASAEWDPMEWMKTALF